MATSGPRPVGPAVHGGTHDRRPTNAPRIPGRYALKTSTAPRRDPERTRLFQIMSSSNEVRESIRDARIVVEVPAQSAACQRPVGTRRQARRRLRPCLECFQSPRTDAARPIQCSHLSESRNSNPRSILPHQPLNDHFGVCGRDVPRDAGEKRRTTHRSVVCRDTASKYEDTAMRTPKPLSLEQQLKLSAAINLAPNIGERRRR